MIIGKRVSRRQIQAERRTYNKYVQSKKPHKFYPFYNEFKKLGII